MRPARWTQATAARSWSTCSTPTHTRGSPSLRGTGSPSSLPNGSARTIVTDGEDSTDADNVTTTAPPRHDVRRSGPFDRSEVESLEGRLDLGALWLTGVPGMELRLEVEEESQNVVGVTAVLGESAVQLQAFAAPRSEGIWEDIRTEIA